MTYDTVDPRSSSDAVTDYAQPPDKAVDKEDVDIMLWLLICGICPAMCVCRAVYNHRRQKVRALGLRVC